MSVKDDDSAILSEDLDGESNPQQDNIREENDMLLLSSSPSSNGGQDDANVKPGPSGLKSVQNVVIDLNTSSNIVIDDSASEEISESSVEVIENDEEDSEEELDESDSDESISYFLDGKVQIYTAQGSFFIWDAEDVHMLREECRIVGKLVGCLPQAPRQNIQLGLPLQLMPEEAKLLEEIEVACVVEEVEPAEDINELRAATFEAMREENYKTQQKLYKESRREEVKQLKDTIIEGRKAKKRKIQELENSQIEKGKSDNESSFHRDSDKDGEKDSESNEDIKNKLSSVESEAELEDTAAGEKKVLKMLDSDMDNASNDIKDDQNFDSFNTVSNAESSLSSSDLAGDGGKLKNNETGLALSSEAINSISNVSETEAGKETGVEMAVTHGIVDKCQTESMKASKEDCVIVDEDENEKDDDEDFNVDAIVSSETNVKHSLIQLYTENPWKEILKRPKNWIFPLSQKEFLRYEVFRDLWKKGYCLTSGSKFGGDFLVYPGDPARYHSHFIAVCIDKTVDLSALDIISLGRLGSNVRKTVLLCAFNKLKQIVYTSLQWTGMS